MNRTFYWVLFISLLAATQIQAQKDVNISNANQVQILLRQPNTLINDFTLPLELAQKFIVKGRVLGEKNEILSDVTVKLISIAKNKVEKPLAYNPQKGTFQGSISHTGTYLVLIKKAGYTFHTEYIKVEDKTYTKPKMVKAILKKHQK
ncbi:hypothetical protein BKI52_02010 [marine bacterium AO1-C]|nr:hypothetical protein BKI52_02010 [marine bacterium AO1-C]